MADDYKKFLIQKTNYGELLNNGLVMSLPMIYMQGNIVKDKTSCKILFGFCTSGRVEATHLRYSRSNR